MIKHRKIKASNIVCSNLTHFDALLLALKKASGLKHVDYPVPNSSFPKIRIDIVCDNGVTWIKVIARNSKLIKAAVEGQTSYGTKSILDQAKEMVEAANLNPCLYQTPKILFLLTKPIDKDLVMELNKIGVEVQSILVASPLNKMDEIKVLNLDVTTLIAYVSSITNGGQDKVFDDRVLQEQVCMERRQPTKIYLDQLFVGKKLICCETAVKSFKTIVNLLGGPGEKQRAVEFLKCITVLPDESITDELSQVTVTGKIKERSLKIFSFGLKHKAINVTANEGFYRSIKMQKINIPVYLHGARALTEQKEIQ